MKILHLFLMLFVFQQIANAQVIPSNRRTDWSIAGYRDSIPAYPNIIYITSYGGIGNGVAVNDVAIQNAIAALNGRSGTIYFPTGNFLFHAGINLPDSVILKGNSPDSTTISFNLGGNGDLIRIEGSIGTLSSTFTANAYKDSTFITVGNVGLFSPGDYLRISQNDSTLLFSNWAYGSVGQIVQVKSIVANRINLNSPLRKDYVVSDSCKVRKITPRHDIGIECLKVLRLDPSVGQTTNIDITYGVKCWIKGVELDTCNFAHIGISYSSNIEISGCYMHDAFAFGDGGQGYGIATQYASGECLVINNVFNHLRHAMLLQAGANGNVFAYNNSTNTYWVSGLLPSDAAGDMVLHGNYPYLNLYEGNTGQNIVVDNSHGINGPYNTYFRNRASLYGIFMNTGPASDNQNFVGNEVTNSGFLMGLYQLAGNGQLAYGNNIRGTIMPGGTSSFNDTSYFRVLKPGFFTQTATWPGIGIPNVIGTGSIPAQQRYLSGADFTDCTTNYPVIYLTQHTTITESFCYGFSYDFNGRLLTTGGAYQDTLHAVNGADSIVTLQLSMLVSDTTQLLQSICAGGVYNFNGQFLSSAGTYTRILNNSAGCDSLVVLQLSVNNIDTAVSINGSILTSLQANSAYQWIDCYNDSAIIGATNQSFTAVAAGSYKVILTKDGCSDTSGCVTIVITGINKLCEISFSIQPNPARDICSIYLNGYEKTSASIYDISGKKITELFCDEIISQYIFDTHLLSAGIYFIIVTDHKGRSTVKKLGIE